MLERSVDKNVPPRPPKNLITPLCFFVCIGSSLVYLSRTQEAHKPDCTLSRTIEVQLPGSSANYTHSNSCVEINL